MSKHEEKKSADAVKVEPECICVHFVENGKNYIARSPACRACSEREDLSIRNLGSMQPVDRF